MLFRSFFFLLDERNIQPRGGRLCRKNKAAAEAAETQDGAQPLRYATAHGGFLLANRHDDQDQHRDSQDDENQVALAKLTGSEISLGFVGARSQAG